MSQVVDLFSYSLKVLLYIVSILLSSIIFPNIISKILNKFPKILPETEEEGQVIKDVDEITLGRYIGILERIIILIAIFSENVTLIPMLLTAKSIIRFPDVTQGGKHFAEYYLIGTLTSFILALVTGLSIKEIIMIFL